MHNQPGAHFGGCPPHSRYRERKRVIEMGNVSYANLERLRNLIWRRLGDAGLDGQVRYGTEVHSRDDRYDLKIITDLGCDVVAGALGIDSVLLNPGTGTGKNNIVWVTLPKSDSAGYRKLGTEDYLEALESPTEVHREHKGTPMAYEVHDGEIIAYRLRESREVGGEMIYKVVSHNARARGVIDSLDVPTRVAKAPGDDIYVVRSIDGGRNLYPNAQLAVQEAVRIDAVYLEGKVKRLAKEHRERVDSIFEKLKREDW